MRVIRAYRDRRATRAKAFASAAPADPAPFTTRIKQPGLEKQ
jgi:hypothetical protein